MTGRDLVRLLDHQRTDRHRFIKWWRNGDGFVAIELLDSFLDSAKVGDHFDGFRLLDMDDLWEIIEQKCSGRVKRIIRDDDELLVWGKLDASGGSSVDENSPYTPESLFNVFKVEIGNDLDAR